MPCPFPSLDELDDDAVVAISVTLAGVLENSREVYELRHGRDGMCRVWARQRPRRGFWAGGGVVPGGDPLTALRGWRDGRPATGPVRRAFRRRNHAGALSNHYS